MSQRLFYPLSVGLVALSLLFLASGCAPKKKSNSSNLSSRAPVVNDSQYLLAECNRIDLPQVGLKGQISTYYNMGQLSPTYLNVNFTQVPAGVLSSTQSLQVFRWAERVPGQRQTNSVPVTMYFAQKGTGAISNPNGSTMISKATLDAIISQQSLATLGITAANFFERHFVILTGMETQWDAAMFVLYSTTAASANGSVLLPAFYSNPNIYAQANASTELQALHPNFLYRSSGASENDYYQLTEQICAGFFGSVRIPASVMAEPEAETTGFLPQIIQHFKSWFESMTGFLHNFFGL